MVNRLDIAVLRRPSEYAGVGLLKKHRQTKAERFTVDFVVDGTRLFSLIKDGDLCGTFSAKQDKLFRSGEFNQREKATLLNADDEAQRIALYVCPECGDLWCGAVTCELTRIADRVVWSRFAYECGYVDDGKPDFLSYENVGPFEFDASQYAEMIERAAGGGV